MLRTFAPIHPAAQATRHPCHSVVLIAMTVGKYRTAGRFQHIHCILFDLDDTLYRVETVAKIVRSNIERYMVEELNIPQANVSFMTNDLYVKYGTTMAGLVAAGYQLDFQHWHDRVHGTLDYSKLLTADKHLRDILQSINLPKYILTNADAKHTEACLEKLGIADCFEGTYCFETIMAKSHILTGCPLKHPVLCKPNPQVYELVLKDLKLPAESVMFFDDSIRNVSSAHDCGITSVLVGKDTPTPGADMVIPSLLQLPSLLPELFENPDSFEHHRVCQANEESSYVPAEPVPLKLVSAVPSS